MDEILLALGEINKKLDTLNAKYDAKEKEIEYLKNENKVLHQKMVMQEQRIQQLEKQYREKKIIVHGIKEEMQEHFGVLKVKVMKVMEKIGVDKSKEKDIVEIRRIGKKEEGKERPLQVEVTTMEMKREIFKKKKYLKGQDVWIMDDLPEQVRQQRRELAKIMYEEREKGNRAYMVYNKLMVNGKIYSGNKEKEIMEQENAETNTPSQKKEYTRTFSQRSPDEDADRQEREKITAVTRTFYGTKNP